MLLSFQTILILLYLFKKNDGSDIFYLSDASAIIIMKIGFIDSINPVSFLKQCMKHKGEIVLNRSFRCGPSTFSTDALKSDVAGKIHREGALERA